MRTQLERPIKIQLAKVPTELQLSTRTANLLNSAQRKKAHRRSLKGQRETLASRLLLTCCLGENAEIIELDDAPPHALDRRTKKNIPISLSHSNDWVAVAVAEQETTLGIDIEKIKNNWSREKAAFFCNPSELTTGMALPQEKRHRYFTQRWSLREALFKAQQLNGNHNLTGELYLSSAWINEDYVLSICSDQAHHALKPRVKTIIMTQSTSAGVTLSDTTADTTPTTWLEEVFRFPSEATGQQKK